MLIQIISHKTPLHGMLSSMQGGRPENQDDFGFLDTPLGFLLVVCDGMGGGPSGKLASYLAKSEVLRVVSSANEHSSRTDTLKRAVSSANSLLLKRMETDMRLRGMGTTLVAVLINQKSAVIAHLGDSRCYRTHSNQIVFRTKDHSLVGELVQNKVITEEQARTSPQSNVITRALGATSNHVPEIEEIPYQKGDRFILCTDGVWGMFRHDVLKNFFVEKLDVASIVNKVALKIDEVGFSQGGKHDNHTLAIIEMDSFSLKKDKMDMHTKLLLSLLMGLLVVSVIFNVVCYLKLGAQPQLKMLSELKYEVERLKPYESRYNSLVKNGESELGKSVISLTNENEDLKRQMHVMQTSIDSLQRENQQLRQDIEECTQNAFEEVKKETTSKEHTPNKQSQKASQVQQSQKGTSAALNMVEKIVRLFDEMKNAKSKVAFNDAIKKKQQVRDTLVKELRTLDDLTHKKYHPTLEAVERQLKENDGVLFKVAAKDKDGYFLSTENAKKSIENLKTKIETVKAKLNQ